MPELTPEQKAQLDRNIRSMLSQGASEQDVMSYASDFRSKYDVATIAAPEKKKETFNFTSPLAYAPAEESSKAPSKFYSPTPSEFPSQEEIQERTDILRDEESRQRNKIGVARSEYSRDRTKKFLQEDLLSKDIEPGVQTIGYGATDARVGGEGGITGQDTLKETKTLGKAAILGLSTVASGTLKAIGTAAKDIDLFGEYKDKTAEELGTYKAGKWIEDMTKDLVGELSPEEQDQFAVKLAQGFGNMAGFLAGGVGGRLLKLSPTLTSAALGAAVQGSSEYENAIASGATPDQASKIFWLNSIVGTTEALPIMAAFRKLDKYTGGLATGALARKLASTAGGRLTSDVAHGFIEESTQEVVQQFFTNVVAKNTYDEARSLWDGLAESAAIGGIIGSAMNGVISSIREKRMAGNLTAEEGAQLTKAEAFAREKLQEATDPNVKEVTLSKKPKPPKDDTQAPVQGVPATSEEGKEVQATPEEKIIDLVEKGAVLGGAEMAIKADPSQATEALRFIAQQAYGIKDTGEQALAPAEIENKEVLALAKERFPTPESTLEGVARKSEDWVGGVEAVAAIANEPFDFYQPSEPGNFDSAKAAIFKSESGKFYARDNNGDPITKIENGVTKDFFDTQDEVKKAVENHFETQPKEQEEPFKPKNKKEARKIVKAAIDELSKNITERPVEEEETEGKPLNQYNPGDLVTNEVSGGIDEIVSIDGDYVTVKEVTTPAGEKAKGKQYVLNSSKVSDYVKAPLPKTDQPDQQSNIPAEKAGRVDEGAGKISQAAKVEKIRGLKVIEESAEEEDELFEGKRLYQYNVGDIVRNEIQGGIVKILAIDGNNVTVKSITTPAGEPASGEEYTMDATYIPDYILEKAADTDVAILPPEPTQAKPKKVTTKKEVKEKARKIRDEKLRNEIDGLLDEFMKGGDILTSGGLDPKKIEIGTKIIGGYIKAGIYKFSDILEDVYLKYGDKLHNFVDAFKAVYSAYYNTQATDEEAALMDASTRGIKLSDIIKTQTDDRGTDIVDEPQVVSPTPRVVKSDTQEPVRADEPRGKDEVGAPKSRDSDKSQRVVREQEDADRPSGRDSEGEHDVPLNGNEQINEELGGTSDEQPIPEPKEQSPVVTPLQHNGNFIIPPDFTNTKSFNVGQKLQDNIDALKVLITLEKEGRNPTYDEQKTLFKYVGWGGIKEIGFNPDSDSGWAASNQSLRPKIKEVLGLIQELDPQDAAKNIAAIKSSVLNAHYTAIPVIRGIWDVLRKGGFKGGNVLEPSAGTGNFIGAMPFDFLEKSKIIGIELDFVTSQILKNLYPNHVTKNYGYEEAPIGEGAADLVISNIPFGNYAVHDPKFLKSKDPVLKKATKKIHSYFFARAIKDVKPNGIIAFVTTTGILDSKDNRELREMIATKTEFLGAIRLPNDTFRGNANTSVTTDIIFLRKFGESEAGTQRHEFLDTSAKSVKHKDRDETLKVFYNEYFHDNPEMVLGEVRAGSMYGRSKDDVTDAMTVMPTGINIEEGISKLGGKIFSKETITRKPDTEKQAAASLIKDGGERVGNIVEVSDGVYGIVGDVIENPQTGERSRTVSTIRVPKKYQDALKDLIPLRQALNELYAAEYGDMGSDFIESKRDALNKAYKTFVKNNGTLLENKPIVEKDIDGFNMLALEKVAGKKVTGLADIFTKRVFQPKQKIEKAASISDAIVINLNETGGVDINRMAELLRITPEEVIEKSKGVLFKNPEGGFETKDKYLSGNVRAKLEAAKLAASQDKFYEQNVVALEAVQPKDLNAAQIYAPISASWISTKYLNDFASELFKQNITINRLSTGRVNVNGGDYNTQVTTEYGTSRIDGFQLLEEAIQNRMPIVKDTIDDGVSKKSVVNEIETQKAVEKAESIKAQFDKWLWADDARRNDLVNYYNQHFNNVVVRKYDGSHLTFDGYAGELTPKDHQLDGSWMIMQQMGGILDHVVGSGKTLLMVLTAQKMKQMGLIKKPIILGLKANTGDVADRYRKSFPLSKVLSPTEKDFTPDNRKAFFAKMANNDWDAIIMTHDQFGMITQSREIQMEIIQQEIDALEQDIREAKANNMSKRDLNGLEVRKQNLRAKLLSLTAMAKDKSLKSFEDMGIDFMFVDESQMFKNLAYNTIQRGVAGLGNPLGSNKAFNMLAAIRTLQKVYGGDKGTVFASGTPISNTMVEMYLLFKYLRPNKMAELGINSFDQWANTFARVGSEIEFGVTNSLKPKVRMRDFMNVPEMSSMYREIADVRNDSNLKLEKPEFKKTLRVKTDQNIPAFETVTIGGNKFKVIGRIKGVEKNEYWVSLKSIGKDVKVPPSGEMTFGGSTINYSDTEYSDGLLINVTPTVEQRKFAKRIQKFAETKDGSWIGRPGLTDKEQKAYMLLATNLASKMAIDMRLVDPRYPSSEEGKLAVAAETIFDHYNESSHLKGIQLVFSDLGTPKTGNTAENLFNLIESRGVDRETLETIFGSGAYSEKPSFPPVKVLIERIRVALEYSDSEIEDAIKEANEDNFNVYQELKDKLVRKGIPAEEVVFIHDYKSDKQKKALFEQARAGKVRVIIGSTSKLGTGVNVQEKIVAMHHLDVPWRPSDMEQRNGRGIRQGNKIIEEYYDNELPVYMYATEATLDAYKYQLLGTKQQFIDQAKTGDLTSREISEGEGDEETGISFSAMTAMLSGNPVILEKAKIDKKAKELETSKKAFEQDKYSVKDQIADLKDEIKATKHRNEGLQKDKELFEKNAVKNEKTGEWVYEATIAGEKFSEKTEKTPDQIAEAEVVKKLAKDFKEPKVGAEYTFRDGEKVKVESTIDDPDGKKWQVRVKGKLQFLTTEQLKSNVTGEKKEKTVRNRVGDKIVELRNSYLKNDRYKPEKIGTIHGFDIIMSRSLSDIKTVHIGIESPVSDVVYYPTQSSDPHTIASFLQRQVRDLGDEIDARKRANVLRERDVAEKTKYLESLPDSFPKQAQLDETLAQQKRIAERLREMAAAVKLPTIEELETLGESVSRRDIYDKYVDALDIDDLYAITEDNVVVKINDITELQESYKTTDSRYFTYKEEKIGTEEEGGSIGDTIRKAKIRPGGLQSNIAGIPIALYNAAIETIALAVDAGATITQAIKKAIADHKLDKQKRFNKDEFIKQVEDASGEIYLENEGGLQDKMIGIKHESTKEIRDRYFLPEYERSNKKDEELEKEANELIENGYNIQQLIRKIEGGTAPSGVENYIIAKYLGVLDAEFNNTRSDATLQEIHRVLKATDKIGSLQSEAFRTRKILMPSDESLASFFIREMEALGVDELTEEQKDTVQKEWDDIEKAKNEFNAYVFQKESEIAGREIAAKIAAEKLKPTKKTDKEFSDERKQIISDIKDKLRRARGESQATILPYAKELIAISPDVAKLVKNLVANGVTKLSDIVDHIHEILKDEIKGITKHDVNDLIAGVYDEKKQTKKQIAKQLYEIRQEAKLINEYEALQRGEVPAKEEKKIQRNQRLAELRKKIKEHDLSKLADYKARTEKQIYNLLEKLRKGDYAKEEKKAPLKLDEAGRRLKDRLIKLKTEREIRIMKEQYENRSRYEKTRDWVTDKLNLPRTLMASMDYSAPLRQGIVAGVAHPLTAAKAGVEMFRASFSQKHFDRWVNDTRESPRFEDMKRSGLAVTDPHSPFLAAREEQFMNNTAEKIPLIGRLIKGSERAYVMFLNKMRVDLYNRFADRFEENGETYDNNPKLYEAMARLINNETGRGNLGVMESAAPILNTVFFSPRLIASRVNLLSNWLNPQWYRNTPKQIRVMYMKDMLKFIGLGATILGLIKMASAGGDDEDKLTVETDPRSTDFGKLKAGNTRWDIWGGFQQYIRVITQIASGEKKSATTGELQELDSKGRFGESRGNVLTRFVRGKLAPVPSMAVDFFQGTDIVGEKVTVKGELEGMLPLIYSDVKEAMQDRGVSSLYTVGLPAMFGVGVNTYEAREPAPKFKVYSKSGSRDVTKEEYKRYSDLTLKKTNEYLDKYKKSGVYFDKYGELTLQKSDSKIKKPFTSLSEQQLKDLTGRLRAKAADEARKQLKLYTKEQAK